MDARQLFLRFFMMTHAYGFLVVGIAAPVIIIGTGLDQDQIKLFVLYMLPMIGITLFVVDTLTLWILFRPIAQGIHQQHKRAAYIRARNFPLWMFARIALIHMPLGTLTAFLYSRWLISVTGVDLPDWQMLTINGLVTSVGVSHAIIEYFASLRIIRPVIPLLYTDEQPQQIFPVKTRLRLFLISVWMFLMPMGIVSVVIVARINVMLRELNIISTPPQFLSLILWIITFLIAVTMLIFFMARLMAGEIQFLIEQLKNAMRFVAQGNLGTMLDITTTDEFAELYQGFNHMTDGLREREHLHDAFGRYVSPELAERVLSGELNMEGKLVQATVMFVDIRGFTALSEKLSATQIVEMLNRFFAQVEPIIKAHGGWINKFLGDGFMVTFGAPVPYDDHALRAVHTALAIREQSKQFTEPVIKIGIGIESGEMVAGSIGSPERLEYTVIGDTVNVASRIESLNKEMGTEILISHNVYAAAHLMLNGTAQMMPPAQVKGKAQPVQVYSI